jgi:hypothetical protein
MTVTAKRAAPLLGLAALFAFAVPSTGLAVVSLTESVSGIDSAAIEVFTPATVDPELAAQVADISSERGFRFTPAGTRTAKRERPVTVAVRVDEKTVRAISVRSGTNTVPGAGGGIAGLQASRYNLGAARGYQSFARQVDLRAVMRDVKAADIADLKPTTPAARDKVANTKPSRLQPRIALEGESVAGRSPNTLNTIESQTVEVGGSFRLSPNLDVTAGVRLSQERDRLDPLTNSVQDSQAVYVGTRIKF